MTRTLVTSAEAVRSSDDVLTMLAHQAIAQVMMASPVGARVIVQITATATWGDE